MNRFQNDDELDRAIFALPLEEPPPGLREQILAATIYRPGPAFKAWEVWSIGAGTGLLVWLLAWIALDSRGTAWTLNVIGSALLGFFGQPSTVLWLALGAAVAIASSQLNLIPVHVRRRSAPR